MAAEVSRISEGRGRAGDVVVITGSGFSPTANTVTFDGIAAVLGPQSDTSITATVPGGLVADRHAIVLVTNTDDTTSSTWWWFVKPAVAALATYVAPVVVPGTDELDRGLQNSDMRTCEAKYFERLVAVLELIPYDLLTSKGTLVGMGDAGLEQVSAGILGELLTSLPDGPAFGPRSAQSLTWGRQLLAANDALTPMEAGAVDSVSAVTGTEEVVTAAGRLAVVCVYCRSSGSSRVVEINVLVNGVIVHTENPLPGLLGGQRLTFFPSAPVVPGDRVQIQIRKNNAITAWLGQAYGSVV